MNTQAFAALIPHLLRPPGGGIPAFSAGVGAALALQRRHYEGAGDPGAAGADEAGINARWLASLASPRLLERAEVALLGVPSDTGAGIRRGAAYGPRGVRAALLDQPDYLALLRAGRVVDLGDVFVNPHLLHDDLLSGAARSACQQAMYPSAESDLRARLPVSALSQVRLVLMALLQHAPHLRVFVIGGDHSVAWPVTQVLAARHPGTLGIVQPDAHTDLLPTRLGVPYCFGTWSFHANRLLGAGGRLVQVGIRQSGRERGHWESTTGVRQLWAEEINRRPEAEVTAEIVAHLRERGVRQVYFSNDIDGTDESEALATGTPAPAGLRSSFVLALIDALAAAFELVGADVMEVAPDLAPAAASAATCALAARYTLACLRGQLRR